MLTDLTPAQQCVALVRPEYPTQTCRPLPRALASPLVPRPVGVEPELDLGVHLTLNAEHESWTWPPVRDVVPSLAAPNGGMWRTSAETAENAAAHEVEAELRAQVDRALEAGIDVTHLDAHMGTVFQPAFVESYATLALEYRLPVFLPRVDRQVLEQAGITAAAQRYVDLISPSPRLLFRFRHEEGFFGVDRAVAVFALLVKMRSFG